LKFPSSSLVFSCGYSPESSSCFFALVFLRPDGFVLIPWGAVLLLARDVPKAEAT